jgi:hypothetical protein
LPSNFRCPYRKARPRMRFVTWFTVLPIPVCNLGIRLVLAMR